MDLVDTQPDLSKSWIISTIDCDIAADNQAVLDHLAGKPLDPEVARRIRARAESITEEIRRTHGVQDICRLSDPPGS